MSIENVINEVCRKLNIEIAISYAQKSAAGAWFKYFTNRIK